MMEVYNIIGNIPYVLLISVLVLIFSPSFWTMVFALTVTGKAMEQGSHEDLMTKNGIYCEMYETQRRWYL